jgi:phospholipase/lecithinase/hemolysin
LLWIRFETNEAVQKQSTGEEIMKRRLNLSNTLRFSALTIMILIGALAGGLRAQANSEPFSHIPIFGDSLSDTGNFYRLSGGYPPSPYYEGRFCNGPIWVEYLAAQLGMDYRPEDNYAVAGANTGTSNHNDGAGHQFPGLLDEVDSFIKAGGVTEPERALFIVGAGANDFFDGLATLESPQSIIANGVNNTVLAIQRLSASGAEFILVMNLPDLGVTPGGVSTGMGAQLTQMCIAYNQVLDLALDRLSAAGIPTLRLDAFAVLDRMALEPATYGFSNVSVPLSLALSAPNPEQFLFWDPVHPTTQAHKVLAAEAMQQLMNTFSPSKGKGDPKSKSNGLHGLVNAEVHNP